MKTFPNPAIIWWDKLDFKDRIILRDTFIGNKRTLKSLVTNEIEYLYLINFHTRTIKHKPMKKSKIVLLLITSACVIVACFSESTLAGVIAVILLGISVYIDNKDTDTRIPDKTFTEIDKSINDETDFGI